MLLFLAILLPLLGAALPVSAAAQAGPVYVIPVNQEIERGLQQFMERGFKEAADMKARLIVLDIDTPGGRVDTADALGKLIRESEIPTVAYIRGKAASAGSYLALNADKIAMEPGSYIGAAALVDSYGNHIEDAKLVAAWKSQMASAAESSGRNADIARGMVDANIVVELPGLDQEKEKGQIISLSSEEALKVGYADKIASSTDEVVEWMGYSKADVFQVEHSFAERLAAFLTNPVVQVVLLFFGIAGVVIEILVPGFGVPGILGITAFALYFFGNYVAGFAGNETWLLFIIGLVLLVLELFVPSFGILGILGSVSLVAGVVRAAYDTSHAFLSLGIAFGAALVVVVIVAIVFKERGVWNRFILSESLTSDKGYSSIRDRSLLVGQLGVSVTPLRPAGTVLIDGERIDVVTEGGFIAANTPVVVQKVEGSRIVVQQQA
ncbi:nodulation protein NfeD [Paenibacillus sp. JX-17]|uniref:Nodulation protein NfeD n=1 Tax=Paenibacillus lacisoli TaxID=3064525 RepID=A0ABT9C8B7_9BACL|nr:nodulation protein NfeD [Paenibacillus sp. JX-17]MDO7905461.1 nodulation protein NfeD [Paenibacillus sp. JX-17]